MKQPRLQHMAFTAPGVTAPDASGLSLNIGVALSPEAGTAWPPYTSSEGKNTARLVTGQKPAAPRPD